MRLFLYNFAPRSRRGGENVVPHHGRVAPALLIAWYQHDSTISYVQLHSITHEHERLLPGSYPQN